MVDRESIMINGGIEENHSKERNEMILHCPLVIKHKYLHATSHFNVDRAYFSFYDLSKFMGREINLIINLGSNFLLDLHNIIVG